MATVLMLGKPPPANPYRHPVSARGSALPTPTPSRRIDHRGRIHRTHRELKTRRTLRKVDAGSGRHRATVQLGAAARHDLALAPPLRLKPPRPARRHAIVERVLALREAPDPHTRVRPRGPRPEHGRAGPRRSSRPPRPPPPRPS